MLDSATTRDAGSQAASLAPSPSPAGSDAGATARANAGVQQIQNAINDNASPSAAPAPDGKPTERDVYGIRVIAAAGVRPEAVDECVGYVQLEIGNNVYAQNQLREKRTTLIIIPANTHMTDLPPFKQLAGATTPDGRGWENVRGSGGMQIPDGSFALAVPEENLVCVQSMFAGYGPGYSVGMHEFAHTLQDAGMTPLQAGHVTQMYAARQALAIKQGAVDGIFTDKYASSNEKEYFAQSTDCFFGKNLGEGANGRDWLALHDPDMYEFLVELYEHSHDNKGNDIGMPPPAIPPSQST